jgi:hypothetical protein
MPPSEPTADDLIADWLSPRQAVEILDAAYPPRAHVSKQVLLERLRVGMVQAVAGHSVFDGGRQTREVFYKIPSDDWGKIDTADILWITGELTYRRREFGSEHTTVRHYNVRFEPQGVHAIIKSASKTAEPELASTAEMEPESKGPPVSDDHLKAWFELYRRAYTGPADTMANALKSARGMFPGKFVSRDRVRDLAGGRTPGRKSDIRGSE